MVNPNHASSNSALADFYCLLVIIIFAVHTKYKNLKKKDKARKPKKANKAYE